MDGQPCGCACSHTAWQHHNGECLPCRNPYKDAQREQEAAYWREQEAAYWREQEAKHLREQEAAYWREQEAKHLREQEAAALDTADQLPRSERLFGSPSRGQRSDPAAVLAVPSQPSDAELRQLCGKRVAATSDACLLTASHRGWCRSRLPR